MNKSPKPGPQALPDLLSVDLTMRQLRSECQQAALELQERAERASQDGYASETRTLITASGIMTDGYLAVQDVPDQQYAEPRILCGCHGSPAMLDKAHRLLSRWLPKALLQVRQIKACLSVRPLPIRNLADWALAVNISLKKIISYYGKLVDMSPELAVLSAHRHELVRMREVLKLTSDPSLSPSPLTRE